MGFEHGIKNLSVPSDVFHNFSQVSALCYFKPVHAVKGQSSEYGNRQVISANTVLARSKILLGPLGGFSLGLAAAFEYF